MIAYMSVLGYGTGLECLGPGLCSPGFYCLACDTKHF